MAESLVIPSGEVGGADNVSVTGLSADVLKNGQNVTVKYKDETVSSVTGNLSTTVTGLSANVVKNGQVVTVKQGSDTVSSVTGTLTASATNLSASNIRNGTSVSVKLGSDVVSTVTGTLNASATNLSAGNIKSGVSVQVKLGDTVVRTVNGTLSNFGKNAVMFATSAGFAADGGSRGDISLYFNTAVASGNWKSFKMLKAGTLRFYYYNNAPLPTQFGYTITKNGSQLYHETNYWELRTKSFAVAVNDTIGFTFTDYGANWSAGACFILET